MKKAIFLLFLVCLVGLTSAGSHAFLVNTGQPNQEYDFTFNYTTDIGCSDVILSYSTTIETNQNGIVMVYPPLDQLNRKPHFLCEYRDGSLRRIHNDTDQIFDTIWVDNIYSNNWSNVTITESQISDLDHFTTSDETDPLSLHLNGDNSPTAPINFGNQNLTNSNYLQAKTLNATNIYTSLTQNSIPYIGANGLLTENNSALNYSNTLGTLTTNNIYAMDSIDFDLLGNDGAYNRANMVVDLARVNEVGGITKGQPLYVNGHTGDKPDVGIASNLLHNKSHMFGIALDSGGNGDIIQVQVFGEMRNINTSGFTTGVLHLGDGILQNAIPTNGAHIHVGWATKINENTGIIEVQTEQYNHDFKATSDVDLKIVTGSNDATRRVSFMGYDETEFGYFDGTGLLYWNDNITADWFNGKFNWTTSDTWNSFDGSSLTFNETMLSTIYYNATSYQLVSGTLDGGTLSNTQHTDGNYDEITINFSEVATAPSLDLRINFTDGITSLNQIIIRYKTDNLVGNYPVLQVWDYDTSSWEDYNGIGESGTFKIYSLGIFDSSSHVQDGTLQIRIYKSSTGNINNEYYFDWLAVAKGYGTPSGEERDSLSVHRDGNTPLTGDWSVGEYNITGINYLQSTIFNNTGNVTIGDTLKTDNIHSNTGNITLYNSTGSSIGIITEDGWRGIRTNNPLTPLDILGWSLTLGADNDNEDVRGVSGVTLARVNGVSSDGSTPVGLLGLTGAGNNAIQYGQAPIGGYGATIMQFVLYPNASTSSDSTLPFWIGNVGGEPRVVVNINNHNSSFAVESEVAGVDTFFVNPETEEVDIIGNLDISENVTIGDTTNILEKLVIGSSTNTQTLLHLKHLNNPNVFMEDVSNGANFSFGIKSGQFIASDLTGGENTRLFSSLGEYQGGGIGNFVINPLNKVLDFEYRGNSSNKVFFCNATSENCEFLNNVTIGSIGNAGCISIRDTDDVGWSKLQMLNGAIVNSTGAC